MVFPDRSDGAVGAVLPPRVRDKVIECLRAGHPTEEAAVEAGVAPEFLEIAAVADSALAVALTGRDPYTPKSKVMRQRAEVLRGVALGMTLAAAARAAHVPDSSISTWRSGDSHFRAALDAVRAMVDASAETPRSRLSPARTGFLLQALREGDTVKAAAARVGVSPNTVYAHRRRDPAFAKQMEEARAEGVRTRPPKEKKKPRPQRVHGWEGRYRLIRVDTPTVADVAACNVVEQTTGNDSAVDSRSR